jgi:hypothetical protein
VTTMDHDTGIAGVEAAAAGKADATDGLPSSLDLDALAKEFAGRRDLSGSGSGLFTLALLNQVYRAAWLGERPPKQEGLEEMMHRVGQAALRGIAPRDPLEGMLAAQMVAVHEAAMGCFHRAHDRGYAPGLRQAELSQANKLVRSFAAQLEALDRHRGKGQQTVRVEHVTVQAGGQAIVGAVSHPGGGGDGRGTDDRPHAKAAALADAPEPALRGPDEGRDAVPVAGGAGPAAVPDARRGGRQRRA